MNAMNTPAHVVMNLFILKNTREKQKMPAIIALGALLPDIPIMMFYFYEKVWKGASELIIWKNNYYLPHWQNFFDIFNSIPLAIFGIAMSSYVRSRKWLIFFVSVLLHLFGDIFLHNDDAHRHFYPLSDWRLHSPFSYWDPEHYGVLVGSLEILCTLALGIFLVKSYQLLVNRLLIIVWLCFYLSYGIYVYLFWI